MHAQVMLGEHEVIGAREQMHFRGRARALEHFDGLGCRRHRIDGAVHQQYRTRGDPTDHVLGAEIIHALRGLDGHLHG